MRSQVTLHCLTSCVLLLAGCAEQDAMIRVSAPDSVHYSDKHRDYRAAQAVCYEILGRYGYVLARQQPPGATEFTYNRYAVFYIAPTFFLVEPKSGPIMQIGIGGLGQGYPDEAALLQELQNALASRFGKDNVKFLRFNRIAF
jgi:hypothetical protein